jgi:hypothetical protein
MRTPSEMAETTHLDGIAIISPLRVDRLSMDPSVPVVMTVTVRPYRMAPIDTALIRGTAKSKNMIGIESTFR